MGSKTLKNENNKLYCSKCSYTANRKTDFQKHLQKKKHNETNKTNETKMNYLIRLGEKIYH
jgi:hypothetical protein